MEVCPVFNEHLPVLIEMRRHLLATGEISHEMQQALTSLERYGNSFACSPKVRARWSADLGFTIKDARTEPVEYLWFTGDFAAYHPSAAGATKATARLFHEAGLNFGILYDSERNAGCDVRRIGEEGLFDTLAQKNTETLSKARFQKIVTTDPHTYHVLKNEYPQVNGGHPVFHYTEVLEQVLNSDRLYPRKVQLQPVTYHDPCYLGRYNGIYDTPRKALHHAGIDVIEMPRNRDRALCCGGGGGRIWMEDSVAAKGRPSEIRVREAASLHGVQKLVTSCPKDRVMFEDALKTTGLEKRLRVRDIAEVIEEAVS
jgi:Fe-S oxidoreductase